jgi:hypothetical protein
MSNLPKPAYKNLQTAMRKVISAHVAVSEGIATAAQKEQAKRQAAYHKMESEAALKPETRQVGA